MKKLLTIIIFAISVSVIGQDIAQYYSFQHFSFENGLFHNNIYDINQDKKGFLWVSTADGVYRFDGQNFERISNDTTSRYALTDYNVKRILTLKDGKLLFASTHISIYDPNDDTFRNFPKLYPEDITGIDVDKSGAIITYSNRGGKFAKINPDNFKTEFIEIDSCNYFFIDPNDTIWVAIIGKGFLKFHTQDFSKSNKKFMPSPIWMTCHVILNENIYIGTTNVGILVYNLKNNKIAPFIKKSILPNPPNSLLFENPQQLWITTNEGLYKYNLLNKQLLQFKYSPNSNKSLSANQLSRMKLDIFGNLWIASINGLNKLYLKQNYIIHYCDEPKCQLQLPASQISSIYIDKQSRIFIGTSKGLVIQQGNSRKLINQNPTSPHIHFNNINTTTDLGEGKYLFGGIGLYLWDEKNNSAAFTHPEKNNPESLPSWVIWKVHKGEKSKIIWIATVDGLSAIYPDINNNWMQISAHNFNQKLNLKFKNFKSKIGNSNSLPSDNIWDVIEDKKGRVWLATTNGLSFYNYQTDSFTNFYHKPKDPNSISSNIIKSLLEDKEGNIWIGSEGGGLSKFNETSNNFTNIGEKDGLSSRVVWSILEGKNKQLWLGTNNGVNIYQISSGKISNLNAYDGLINNIHTRGSSARTKEGLFLFGGINGIDVFYEEHINQNPIAPLIVIKDIYINNEKIIPHNNYNGIKLIQQAISNVKKIELPYYMNNLNLKICILHYASTLKIKHNYYLDGLEKKPEGFKNTDNPNVNVAYNALTPGFYTLKFMACNNDGVCTNYENLLIIHIKPPFWKTAWFIITSVLTLILILYILYMIRIEKIKKEKRALECLVIERTKEIESQKEDIALQAQNLQEINVILEEKQQEILSQTEELHFSNLELQKLNLTKDKILSIIAHDLKNPFQSILGLTEIMKMKKYSITDDQRNENIESIYQVSKNTYHLLENLLDWSKAQTNSIPFEPSHFDITSSIQDALNLVSLQAKQKEINLIINKTYEAIVFADKNMVDIIFRNIITNAIKFTNRGGWIKIDYQKNDSYYKISVEDNGKGIEAERLNKLFQVQTVQNSRGTEGEAGTGLGLALCKEFVERNNGQISIESKINSGTIISILLLAGDPNKKIIVEPNVIDTIEKNISIFNTNNIQAIDQNEIIKNDDFITEIELEKIEDQILKEYGIKKILTGNKKLLLIIDDDITIRQIIKQTLENEFNIIEAENGSEGINKANDLIPDLIITDVMMPILDGLQLSKLLSKNEKTSHIPIVMMTARDKEKSITAGYSLGIADYIVKPVQPETLRIRIKNVMQNREEIRKKYIKEIQISPTISTIENHDTLFINNAIKIVEDHLSDSEFTVENFSGLLKMSYMQLYRKMENLTGISPNDFVKTIRLKKAAQLIDQGNLNMAQICYEVGFKDPSYFTKCFKKEFNLNPKEFAERNKSKQ